MGSGTKDIPGPALSLGSAGVRVLPRLAAPLSCSGECSSVPSSIRGTSAVMLLTLPSAFYSMIRRNPYFDINGWGLHCCCLSRHEYSTDSAVLIMVQWGVSLLCVCAPCP